MAKNLKKIECDCGYLRSLLLFAYLLSAGLIIGAALGDLWLDEIWSIHYARTADTVADLLFKFKHDNNHFLNTLFLYYLGKQPSFIFYRLLAIVSGIGSIVLLGHMAQRDWGYGEAICCVTLVGTSYPLLLYFSEARGYAPAIFFAVLAYAALCRNLQSPKLTGLLLFWIASALGLLSHATFAMVSPALFIMNLFYTYKTAGPLKSRLLQLAAHQTLPLTLIGTWYLFFIQNMAIGGGPIYDKSRILKEAAFLLLGFPEKMPFPFLALLTIVIVVFIGTICLRRSGSPQWVFFPFVLFVAPAFLLILFQPTYLYFRYFIICFPFFYLILAYTACLGFRAFSRPYKLVLVLAFIVSIAGQASRIQPLLTIGRGGYSKAIACIVENSPEATIRIGSDNDFQTTMLLNFYLPRLSPAKHIRYIWQSKWRREKPDWLLTHSQEILHQPPWQYRLSGVGTYNLFAEFRFAGVSGCHWFLYQYKGSANRSTVEPN